MDSQLPPNVKTEAPTGASPARSGRAVAAGGPVRRFPKPPAFIPRFLMLCFRPESWAEAARYPTYITLLPLILAIVIGAAAIAGGETSRLVKSLETFAADYDAKNHYPALEINSAGVLSAKGELKEPIRLHLPTMEVLVDPTGKTVADSLKLPPTWFISDREIVLIGPDGPVSPMFRGSIANVLSTPFSEFKLPKAGETSVIDQAVLANYIATHKPLFMLSGIGVGVMQIIAEAIWAAVMMFLICPLIMLATAGPRLHGDAPDRRLILPKRAAYRMAAALLIPIILVSAILRAAGHPVYDVLGGQGAMLFWFFSAGALAIWTGIMARQMFLPKDPRRAGRSGA